MNPRSISVGAAILVALAVGGTAGVRHWMARSPAGAVMAAPAPPYGAAPSTSLPSITPSKRASRTAAPARAENDTAPQPELRSVSNPRDGSQPGAAAPSQPPARLTGKEKSTLVLVSQVGSLRSTVALWKLMHDGREPDFAKFPRWEQFVTPDDKRRTALTRPPVNPFNGLVRVASVAAGVRPGVKVKEDAAGWVYDRSTGKLWATDANGAVFDDAAVDAAALEMRGVKEMPPAVARRSVTVITQSLGSQIALYKLQHDDFPPDFARYPAWDQLRSQTTRDGTILPAETRKGPGGGVYGPYITSLPVNALNARFKVAVMADDPKPGQTVPGDYGFVYSSAAGKLYSLDADGRVMERPLPGAEWTNSGAGDSRSSGTSTLQTVRSQMALYKLQHNDDEVDLTRYPNWEQLTGRTGVDGKPDPAGRYGPYLAKPPVNWRNGSSAVEVLRTVPAGYRTTKKVGFVHDTGRGRIWMVDAQGAVIFE